MLNLTGKPFAMGSPYGGAVAGAPPFVYPSPSPVPLGTLLAAWDARYNLTMDTTTPTKVVSWATCAGANHVLTATVAQAPTLQQRTDTLPELKLNGAQLMQCATLGTPTSSTLYVFVAGTVGQTSGRPLVNIASNLNSRMNLKATNTTPYRPGVTFTNTSGTTYNVYSTYTATTADSRYTMFFGLREPSTTSYYYTQFTTGAGVAAVSSGNMRDASTLYFGYDGTYGMGSVSAIWLYTVCGTDTSSAGPISYANAIQTALQTHYPVIA